MNEFGIIKSLDMLKEIFKFLPEKRKLNIINYNYHLQEKLNIKIEDYKRVSGIYIEGERNGKGKEYLISNNTKIFEGEYLNRKKWNRKGKEYYLNGILKFEGEYLNGKKWNGKGYNNEGMTDFEIKEGNGKGKEYLSNDKLDFEG